MWYSGKVQYRWRMGCSELLLTLARLTELQEQIPGHTQVLASLMTLARYRFRPGACQVLVRRNHQVQ